MISLTGFSDRTVPWGKIGQLTDHVITAAEAAKRADLDFDVMLREVSWVDDSGDRHDIPGRRAVVRADTGAFMSFVSSTVYTPLQYSEAFNFMDTVNPVYVAAGSLRKGRQGFMVVEAPEEARLKVLGDEDPHKLYVLLRTSHDCSRGIEVMAMPLRGRCMNSIHLRSFTKGIDNRWSIKHTTSLHAKLAEAQHSLAKLEIYARRFETVVKVLAEKNLTVGQGEKLLKIVIPMPKHGKTERTETQYHERIGKMLDLWQTAPQVGYAGTGWGLVNAVSEYFEWHRDGGTAESRFIGSIDGQIYKAVNRATGIVLSNA